MKASLSKAIWVHRISMGPQKDQNRPKNDPRLPVGHSVGTWKLQSWVLLNSPGPFQWFPSIFHLSKGVHRTAIGPAKGPKIAIHDLIGPLAVSMLNLNLLNRVWWFSPSPLLWFSTIFHLNKAIWIHRIMFDPQSVQNRPENDLIGPPGPIVGTWKWQYLAQLFHPGPLQWFQPIFHLSSSI